MSSDCHYIFYQFLLVEIWATRRASSTAILQQALPVRTYGCTDQGSSPSNDFGLASDAAELDFRLITNTLWALDRQNSATRADPDARNRARSTMGPNAPYSSRAYEMYSLSWQTTTSAPLFLVHLQQPLIVSITMTKLMSHMHSKFHFYCAGIFDRLVRCVVFCPMLISFLIHFVILQPSTYVMIFSALLKSLATMVILIMIDSCSNFSHEIKAIISAHTYWSRTFMRVDGREDDDHVCLHSIRVTMLLSLQQKFDWAFITLKKVAAL